MARDKTYYQQLLTNSNVVAYLNAISKVEAPTYYTLNGNTTYVPTGPEHPNVIVPPGTSAAFGRYQFMPGTWSEIQAGLGSLDIRKPRDQDIAALYRMDSLRGTLDDVIAGNCIATLNSNASEWAALPKTDGSFAYPNQGGPLDAAGFCKLVNSLKGTTLPQGPLVNNNVPTGTSPANNPNNNTFTLGNANFADISCPPIKEEDLYKANYQITNPGCKISGPIQPITGPSTNGGTVNNVRGTNKGNSFSVNSQGFAACTSLRSPIKEGDAVFTSGYGWRWGKIHGGVDLAGPVGTPIYAASNGKVTYARWNDGGYGNLVIIMSPENIETLYAHLETINCSEGQQVTIGQQIGEMGSTGFSTGPHLHFEVDLGNGKIDPEECIRFR
jgi:murein DD-endopeptidase MepM/ murein hydrolase activator NlpD/muramidase (phage lysozyme)